MVHEHILLVYMLFKGLELEAKQLTSHTLTEIVWETLSLLAIRRYGSPPSETFLYFLRRWWCPSASYGSFFLRAIAAVRPFHWCLPVSIFAQHIFKSVLIEKEASIVGATIVF